MAVSKEGKLLALDAKFYNNAGACCMGWAQLHAGWGRVGRRLCTFGCFTLVQCTYALCLLPPFCVCSFCLSCSALPALNARAGNSLDLSHSIMDRALVLCDSCYRIPHTRLVVSPPARRVLLLPPEPARCCAACCCAACCLKQITDLPCSSLG